MQLVTGDEALQVCRTPVYLEDRGFIACRYCWQCRKNRVNDLVGRCIAERTDASGSLAVTLTYRGDGVESVVFRYGDFQRFIKRLRSDGFAVRYMCVGEFGSKKGRVHWHAILFFRGKVPELDLNARRNWRYWPHGFTYAQVPDYRGFAYVLKYALKDADAEVSTHRLSMSKKPPLGDQFFRRMVEEYVRQGLSPQEPVYSFFGATDNKGKRRKFWIQGRTRELFAERFIRRYAEVHGRDYPYAEFLEEMTDYWVRQAHERSLWSEDIWSQHLAKRGFWGAPRAQEPQSGPVQYIVGPGDVLLARFSDGTVDLQSKGETWHVNGTRELEKALVLAGIERSLARSLCEAYSSGQSGTKSDGESLPGRSGRRGFSGREPGPRRRRF